MRNGEEKADLFFNISPRQKNNKKKIYLFSVNTDNTASRVLKISEIVFMLCTRETTDIFNTFDEIYLVFTSKSKYPLLRLVPHFTDTQSLARDTP